MSNNLSSGLLLRGIMGMVVVGVVLVCVCFVGINGIWFWLQSRPIAPPSQLLTGVAQIDGEPTYHPIYRRAGLQEFVPGIQNGTVVVVEVTLESGATERRAYLELEVDQWQSIYLGPLRAIPAGGPVELLFFEVNGSRLAVAWVDPTFTSRLVAVSLVRSEQPGDVPGDDNLSRLSYGPADGQVAFILLRQYDRWRELIQVRVSAKGSDGYFHVEDFPVPYPLSAEFERHSITWP